MNRLITVVTKGIGSIRKAIVNYMSQPKEVQAAASAVTVGRTDEEEKIPGSISWFTDHQKEEPEELHQFYKRGTLREKGEYAQKSNEEKLTNSMIAGNRNTEMDGNYSINHKLSYNKKKTQRCNWDKWKKRNR
ncbi:hypothetical protein [Bacillus cereus group sp. BfR-BA-01324]|uniref:hypothetical protein n=1 Tax=Bacillus cereus group sp. BfR-BA-01324 TaxID=2920300 RepID=UPI001F590F04|nr:hypothetical protein [Bacillus cereus group sp. BfR-BA-01324]